MNRWFQPGESESHTIYEELLKGRNVSENEGIVVEVAHKQYVDYVNLPAMQAGLKDLGYLFNLEENVYYLPGTPRSVYPIISKTCNSANCCVLPVAHRGDHKDYTGYAFR